MDGTDRTDESKVLKDKIKELEKSLELYQVKVLFYFILNENKNKTRDQIDSCTIDGNEIICTLSVF